GLVAGELRGVDHQHVAPASASPRGRRRTRRPCPDDDHVGSRIHSSQYVGRVRTPASVVAGVDFGDPVFAREVRDGVARIEDLMQALPRIARAVSSNPDADVYLAESIRAWPDQAELAHRISDAGWSAVRWRNLTGGIFALHAATKPLS
ncbi:MAG: demethylmenaquinone methyltransferase / 2-methoxy-6-polyprenyl,4-benzoquinol methylase, partial [Mycobacterium sp.]|nr:demethylmenaquinone methyltransferase / 2-methoxy-6-polyprenyl,4-benzoquinol methylase [Mycobacterium sp.]